MPRHGQFVDDNEVQAALALQGFTADEQDLHEILLRTNALIDGLLELKAAHQDLPEGLGHYNGWWLESGG